MGANCDSLIAYLFLFCYERDFIMSLSVGNLASAVETFKSYSRYLDDLLIIDNPYILGIVKLILPNCS